MLVFQSDSTSPPSTIYMGKDKYENDLLIKYGYGENDVWFHIDRYSSAHLYLKLIPGFTWDNLPKELLQDCAQLVKANSIEGNKKNNVNIIYTPWSNLKKTQGMEAGEVSFYKQNQVKKFHIEKRENAIINILQKTKVEVNIDYEKEKISRQRQERAIQKSLSEQQKKDLLEIQNKKQADARMRSYADIFESRSTPSHASHQNNISGMDIKKYEEDFFM